MKKKEAFDKAVAALGGSKDAPYFGHSAMRFAFDAGVRWARRQNKTTNKGRRG